MTPLSGVVLDPDAVVAARLRARRLGFRVRHAAHALALEHCLALSVLVRYAVLIEPAASRRAMDDGTTLARIRVNEPCTIAWDVDTWSHYPAAGEEETEEEDRGSHEVSVAQLHPSLDVIPRASAAHERRRLGHQAFALSERHWLQRRPTPHE